MPAPFDHDVFVSYHSKDVARVRPVVERLRRARIASFFDETAATMGDGPARAVSAGMQRSRAIAIFVGPNGLGPYQGKIELGIATNLHTYNERPVVVVLLGGAQLDGERDDREAGLLAFARVEWRDDDEDASFATLYQRLTGTEYTGDAAPAPATTSAGDAAIRELARLFDQDGLTLFVGGRAHRPKPDLPPRAWEIARELWRRLDDRVPDDHECWLRLESVGPFFSAREGPKGLQDAIASYIRSRSGVTPPAHAAVAQLAGALIEAQRAPAFAGAGRGGAAPDGGDGVPRQLIVTTTLDLALERALLLASVPFTRIVQLPNGARWETTFADVSLASGPPPRLAVRFGATLDGADPRSAEAVDALILRAPHTEARTPGAAAALDPAVPLILYKYQGSVDVPESVAVSTDHFINAARKRIAPKEITRIVSTTSSLFVGLAPFSADFSYLFYTLLEKAFETGKHYNRYGLQLHPELDADDVDRRLDARLWDHLKRSARKQFEIDLLEEETEPFLHRLRDAIATSRPAPW